MVRALSPETCVLPFLSLVFAELGSFLLIYELESAKRFEKRILTLLILPFLPLLFFFFSLLDEDRLSKRKSIGETISLQVEVESRNSPEKEEVGNTCICMHTRAHANICFYLFHREHQLRKSHLKH